MADRRTVEQQTREFEIISAKLRNPSQRLLQRILGNAAVIAHNEIRLNFLRSRAASGSPWPKLSGLTTILKRAKGQGRRRGRASGKLEAAIGPPLTVIGKRVSSRSFVRWRRNGFRFGENLPKYAVYFSRGSDQSWGPKQAAFLVHQILEAHGVRGKRRRRKKREGRKERIRRLKTGAARGAGVERPSKKKRTVRGRVLRSQKQEWEKTGFDFAMWKGFMKKRHRTPPREIMHISGAVVDKMTVAIHTSIIDFILHPK